MAVAPHHRRSGESRGVVCLTDADADLAAVIPGEDLPLARRVLTVPLLELRAAEPVRWPSVGEFSALLVLGGALWQETRLAGACAPELLGPGAVLQPEDETRTAPAGPPVALVASRLALLDERFLLALTRWPRLAAVVQARLAAQHHDLALRAAICQLPRVDQRLLMLLWHLAETWGRVRPDGVHLPLRLTHETLGRFVGARRPTVTLALSQLRERALLDRGPDGSWILLGGPPAELDGTHQPTRTLPPLFASGDSAASSSPGGGTRSRGADSHMRPGELD